MTDVRPIIDRAPIRLAYGDKLTPIEARLFAPGSTPGSRTPLNLGTDTVTFSMVLHDAPTTFGCDHQAATVVTAATGHVKFTPGSLATFPPVGTYRCWFERTSGGNKAPYPGNADYFLVEVYDVQEVHA